ncbi:hypothetical protein MSAN_00489200 [Mycena sanguinolenta]|uniref:Uncharacterized protein n=1 Tax=Mycena sanguinolenta TaxID=230812 RepID=A0A8H6Z8P0_9AGAR|nr:hypothetical protein MSAN_00489200 [Mycena sanguinolenta]
MHGGAQWCCYDKALDPEQCKSRLKSMTPDALDLQFFRPPRQCYLPCAKLLAKSIPSRSCPIPIDRVGACRWPFQFTTEFWHVISLHLDDDALFQTGDREAVQAPRDHEVQMSTKAASMSLCASRGRFLPKLIGLRFVFERLTTDAQLRMPHTLV